MIIALPKAAFVTNGLQASAKSIIPFVSTTFRQKTGTVPSTNYDLEYLQRLPHEKLVYR